MAISMRVNPFWSGLWKTLHPGICPYSPVKVTKYYNGT
jgi:hypothetical protein